MRGLRRLPSPPPEGGTPAPSTVPLLRTLQPNTDTLTVHRELKPIHDQLNAIKWKSRREQFKAPDKSSGRRRQNICIVYDLVDFIPLNELMKEETA